MADLALLAGFALIAQGTASLALAPAMLYWTRLSEKGIAIAWFLLALGLVTGIWGAAYIGYGFFVPTGWTWTEPQWRGAIAVLNVAMPFLALMWIRVAAVTTRSPLLAWAAGTTGYRNVMAIGLVLGLANGLWVALEPTGLGPSTWADDAFLFTAGVYVAIAAIVTRSRAELGSLAKRRATGYLLAFLAHDVAITIMGIAATAAMITSMSTFAKAAPYIYLPAALWLLIVFLPLLVYSVLTGQLLDVERKFQLTISKASLAAIFVGVFVAAQTFVSEYFTESSGLLAGAIAAGVLVVAIDPLMRFTNKVGSKAVPVPGDAESFYKEQVEIAYSDGVIGAKERQTLRNVRVRLGLPGDVALRIEESVAA